MNAATAISTTSGTNQPDMRSATAWMGARLRWAWPTILTIRASTVSDPIARASITRLPVPLTVPPVTAASVSFMVMGELQKETLAHIFAMRQILRPDQAAKFDQAVVKALTVDAR